MFDLVDLARPHSIIIPVPDGSDIEEVKKLK